MHVVKTSDRVELKSEEIKKILKEHIEKELNREIDGEVRFTNVSTINNGPEWKAWAHLK